MADYKLPIITGTSLTAGDILRWDGSNWVNYPDSNYGGGGDFVDGGDLSGWDFDSHKEAGSATSTSANHLVDGTATFQTKGVAIGDYVHNTTDDTWAKITAVNSETDLTLDANIMVNGEAYYTGSFKTDGGTYQLDMSSIVPAGAKAIALIIDITDDAAGSYFALRKNGQANWYNRFVIRTQVAGISNDLNAVLSCASDRIFEYFTANEIYIWIRLAIMGWWI